MTVRKEDGAPLASFADGGISLDRDVTVAAASTLNATTADITQLTVGSTAATGAFNSNSSVTANLEVVSNLHVEAPLVRCDPTAPWLSIEGGAQGVLVNDTLLVNGAIAPEASLPYLFLSGGTTGLEMNTKFAAVTGSGTPAASASWPSSTRRPREWRGSSSPRRTTRPRGAGASWWCWPTAACSSTPSRRGAQELFDGVEARSYDRVDGAAKQTGFVAQEVYKSGPLGKSFCKLKTFEDRELMTLDYQRMTACSGRPARACSRGSRNSRRRSEAVLKMAEQEAIGLLEQLARDFNVRDPRKLFQIARREFPDRRDLTSARAAAALRGDVARQILAPKPRSLGKSAAEGPNDRLQADLVDFSQNTRGRNKFGLVVAGCLHPGDCHKGPARQAAKR